MPSAVGQGAQSTQNSKLLGKEVYILYNNQDSLGKSAVLQIIGF